MKKILCVCSVFILIFSIFCMSVNASINNVKEIRINNVWTTKYYAPENFENVWIYYANVAGGYHLVFYDDETVIGAGSSTTFSKDVYYIRFNTLDEAKNAIFEEKEYLDLTKTKSAPGWSNTWVYYNKKDEPIGYATGNAVGIEQSYYDWYYAKNGEYPKKETSGGGGGTSFDDDTKNGFFSWLEKIWNGIISIPDKISELWENIKTGFENTINAITSIPAKIAEWWENITSPYITTDDGRTLSVAEYQAEKINQKLDEKQFYETVSKFGDKFKEFFNRDFNELPTDLISVDLSQNESKVLNFGDKKISILNVSWYQRYKTMIDSFISCFLWMIFMYMLWKNLPNIINGNGAAVSSAVSGYVKYNDKISYEKERKREDK